MESICCESEDNRASLRDGRSQSYVQCGPTPTPRNRPSSPLPVWRACSCGCRDGNLSPRHCQDQTAAARTGEEHYCKNKFYIIYRIQFDFGSVDFIDLTWQFVTHLRFVYIQKANQISIVTAGQRCEQFYTLGATTKTLPSGLLYLFLVCSYVCLTFVSDHFALLQILKQPSTCGMVCVLCITFRQFFNDY